MRVISSLAAFLVISIILVEGIQGYLVHLERSRHASRYMEAGQEIADHLPPGAFIIGAERWWWALRGYPYLAINGIWARWQAASEGDPDPGSFQHFLPASNRTYIIVNNNVRGDIRMFSPSLQDQFWTFLERCAPLAASWENSTYGLIEIYAIQDCYGD